MTRPASRRGASILTALPAPLLGALLAPALLACASGTPLACDRGWSGPRCDVLVTSPGPSSAGLQDPALSFWDGSAVLGDDGRFHLFASRFANACGLDTWQTNSACVRAASTSPLGPYAVEETLAGAFCHNPAVRRAPDGSFMLFSIGAAVAASGQVTDCAAGVTQTAPSGSSLDAKTCIINVQTAPSVLGPWSVAAQLGYEQPIPVCTTNPAPVIHADGSVRLYFRAYDLSGGDGPVEQLYLAEAPSAVGPYALQVPSALIADEAEDPFVWPRSDGSGFHLFYNDKFTEPMEVGGHATSPDGLTWTVAPPAYGLQMVYADSGSVTVARRERPDVLWIDDTRGVLFTGVQPSAANDRSFTSAVPIGDWPAP